MLAACGGGGSSATDSGTAGDGGGKGPDGAPLILPAATCNKAPGGGQAALQAPVLLASLKDSGSEGWLGSPAVADLDGDGTNEIVIARDGRLVVWKPDGTVKWSASVTGRIWASPLVANFAGDSKLEVVVASRDKIYMFDAAGAAVSPFPVSWRDEVRGLAAGDVDGDGKLEIVAVTTTPLLANSQKDIIQIFRADGSKQTGWPPNTTGVAGCDSNCDVTGGYDQNVAVGPIDADDKMDVFVGQDDAYMSWHHGSGVAYLASPIFKMTKTVLGVRFLHDYAEAQQGYANNEATALQAHMTNTAPAIADIDGDGVNDLVLVASVQNASQTDRLKGVALWVLNQDGTRPPTWVTPYHVPAYLAGLWDLGNTNIVAATNQVSIADFDPTVPGLDMVFAGFDGKIHLVGADKRERWSYTYTTANDTLTGGVVIADLTGDGVPEIVFASYSTRSGVSNLYVLDATGAELAKIALPMRGSMAVPTIADVDGDGTLDIVVSLKDGEANLRSALVYKVPGSSANCLPWPTGRGNYLRNGYFKAR